MFGGDGADKFDLIYQDNGYFNKVRAASIGDFEPGIDKIRVGLGVDIEKDLLFVGNADGFTEVIDTRGLSGPLISAIEGLVPGGSLGDINPGGAFNNIVARVFTRDGSSPIDTAANFEANPTAFFENSNGIA